MTFHVLIYHHQPITDWLAVGPCFGCHVVISISIALRINPRITCSTQLDLLMHSSHLLALLYIQALKLWLKNVKFLDHPRYVNPRYRDEALERDLELRTSCCHLQRQERNDRRSRTAEKTAEITDHVDGKGDADIAKRWCVWRDARWPWS